MKAWQIPAYLFLFLGLSVDLTAQEFAPVGAKWTYANLSGYNPTIPCDFNGLYSIEVDSQTTINGKTVNILSHSEYPEQILIHNDSGRVYFYENDSFYLLMDFTLSVGDTMINRLPSNIEFFNPACNAFYDTSKTIVSVLIGDTFISINGDSLLQLSFQTAENSAVRYSITERMGYLYGFLPFPYDFQLLGYCCRDELLCYDDSVIFYERDSISQDCDYIVNVPELSLREIRVYPNPTTDKLIIDFGGPPKASTMKLFSYSGDLRFQTSLIGSQLHKIDLKDFEIGIYFLYIESGNRYMINKIIKY